MTLTDVRVGRWLTIAIGALSDAGPTVNRRRLVLRVLALTVAVFAAVVTVMGGLVAKSVAESLAVDSALQRAGILAVDVAGPAIGNGIPTGKASDIARLDRRVREHVLAPDIAGIKVWTANGTIVYSDEARLIGQRFTLGAEERKAIETNGSDAEISDLTTRENRYERPAGTLLEAHRVVRTPNGTPLLFEVDFRYNEVVTRMDRIWRAFGGIALASLLLLLIALVPVLRGLLTALDRGREQRELLLQRALDASDAERRRIAAAMHDGPVQDLVGASYQLGAASSAVAGTEAARALEQAEMTTRGTVQILRAMLVDIYPPALAESGLGEALGDLAGGARTRGTPVAVRVDPDVHLSPEAERLVFRVARETLANATKHGRGALVRITLANEGGRVVLTVRDDGPGFDAEAMLTSPPASHFGLRLLRDAVTDSGVAAELALQSAPGVGTTWRLTLPA